MNSSPRQPFDFAASLFLPALLLVLTSCSSPSPAWNSQTAYTPPTDLAPAGFGGEVVTGSFTTTATVISVDHDKRLVELKRADGTTITYKALPGALGFDAIQVGDQVKASVAEELAVFIGRNSVPASAGADATKLRVRLPDGTQAAAAEVGTLTFTAKIVSINDWENTVTLQLPAGQTRTIKVSEYVNLADLSVGDTVSVQATEAAVVVLDK